MPEKIDSQEAIISAIKSVFGVVPYAGQLLSEVAFDYRSRIKQNRLNNFTQLLVEFFKDTRNIKLENIKTEEFSDLFESVLKRVVQTKSEEKHRRFKNILVNQIQNPSQNIDNSEIYLDLISSLSEIEINILHQHQLYGDKIQHNSTLLSKLERELNSCKEKLE